MKLLLNNVVMNLMAFRYQVQKW